MPGLPRYDYQPLAPQQIRIIELPQGQSDAPLICSIVAQGLDDAPYEAVSYVWGNPEPPTFIRVTLINERAETELSITENLHKALVGLRHTDEKRRLWVDAICINQNDAAEREAQVRIMGPIYTQAQRTLSWIGAFGDPVEGEARARLAARFVRTFNEDWQAILQASRRLLHSDVDLTPSEETLLKSWLAIKELFDLEYFHRVWIIQEIGLGRHAHLIWGSKDVSLEWTELAKFVGSLDFNGAAVVNHFQLKSWVANHINFVWSTDDAGKPTYKFVEVLHWARIHRATDPRDHIYALLSHVTATIDGKLLIEPDYTISTRSAYIKCGVHVVERTSSLHLLAFVDHGVEQSDLALPTWVPDWHAINIVAPLRYPTHAASQTCDHLTLTASGEGVTLSCRGFVVDSLANFTEMIDPNELTVTSLQKELQKKIPFLIDHIWLNIVAQPGTPPTSMKGFIASLSVILTGGHLNDVDSTSGGRQKQQQSDFAALLLEYERIRVNENPDSFLASLSDEEKSTVREMAVLGSADQFVQDMTWNCMARRIFRTTKGHIGLGPHIMRVGDICVVLPGSIYPLLLRQVSEGFQLVGPTLLDDFMNGQAEEHYKEKTLHEQGFDII